MLKDKSYAIEMAKTACRRLMAGEDSVEAQSESRQLTVKGCWTEYTMQIEVLGVEREALPIEAQNTATQEP